MIWSWLIGKTKKAATGIRDGSKDFASERQVLDPWPTAPFLDSHQCQLNMTYLGVCMLNALSSPVMCFSTLTSAFHYKEFPLFSVFLQNLMTA